MHSTKLPIQLMCGSIQPACAPQLLQQALVLVLRLWRLLLAQDAVNRDLYPRQVLTVVHPSMFLKALQELTDFKFVKTAIQFKNE